MHQTKVEGYTIQSVSFILPYKNYNQKTKFFLKKNLSIQEEVIFKKKIFINFCGYHRLNQRLGYLFVCKFIQCIYTILQILYNVQIIFIQMWTANKTIAPGAQISFNGPAKECVISSKRCSIKMDDEKFLDVLEGSRKFQNVLQCFKVFKNVIKL